MHISQRNSDVSFSDRRSRHSRGAIWLKRERQFWSWWRCGLRLSGRDFWRHRRQCPSPWNSDTKPSALSDCARSLEIGCEYGRSLAASWQLTRRCNRCGRSQHAWHRNASDHEGGVLQIGGAFRMSISPDSTRTGVPGEDRRVEIIARALAQHRLGRNELVLDLRSGLKAGSR